MLKIKTSNSISSWLLYMALCSCSVVLSSGQPAIAQTEPLKLRWQFTQGEVYEVELKQKSTTSSEANNRRITNDQEVDVWLEWEIDIVEPTQTRMTWKYKRIRSRSSSVSIRTQERTSESPIPTVIEFDTVEDRPSDSTSAALHRSAMQFIDQPFRVTMSNQGEVTGVSIPEETLESLRKMPGTMRIRSLMTEEGIKDVFGRTAILLPTDPMEPGHTWKESRSFEIPLGTIAQDTTYEFVGNQPDSPAGHQLIRATSHSAFRASGDDGSPQLEIKSQSSNGEIWFDSDQGRVASALISAEMQTVSPYRDTEIKGSMSTQISLRAYLKRGQTLSGEEIKS
ncbi:MAG TPA: hypothetical protein PKA83_08840 [Pirellulaceae bacterium]|nr:hypothetical protein [Pirellulaceae bacterium]